MYPLHMGATQLHGGIVKKMSLISNVLISIGQRDFNREVRRLARRRKRKSRRRMEGRRILENIPQFSIECGEDKPVTAARKFIHAEGIAPPALLLVRRNEHTTDRYFWAEKGLFGAQYVEENHFLFPSLRTSETEAETLRLPSMVTR